MSQKNQSESEQREEFFKKFDPKLKILAPPLHATVDELVWMDPRQSNFHKVILDTGVQPSESEDQQNQNPNQSVAAQLFGQALQEALTLSQRQTLFNEIKSQPELIIKTLDFTPTKIPKLVEHNHLVLTELLTRLMKIGTNISKYLDVLVSMDTSIHSLEVVNGLIACPELPKDFLYSYISRCITSCSSPQLQEDKYQYMKSRLARVICVFIDSLVRTRVIELQQLIPIPLYFEILAFCIEFSKIREASGLFRHLKELENEGGYGYFADKDINLVEKVRAEMDEAGTSPPPVPIPVPAPGESEDSDHERFAEDEDSSGTKD